MLTHQQMQSYANQFMNIYLKDEHSRFRSYDHIHSVYLQNRKNNSPATLDYVALHLFAFLGSWGMICRGSFLLQKDYRFLIPVVKILNQSKYDNLCDIDLTDPKLDKEWYINTVIELIEELKKYFMSQTYYKLEKGNKENDGYTLKSVSDTVIGKILLGTLSCIPAYDRYVVKGMKAESICGTLGRKSLSDLVDYCRKNKKALTDVMASVNVEVQKKNASLKYSVAKTLDMIFWVYGIEIESK